MTATAEVTGQLRRAEVVIAGIAVVVLAVAVLAIVEGSWWFLALVLPLAAFAVLIRTLDRLRYLITADVAKARERFRFTGMALGLAGTAAVPADGLLLAAGHVTRLGTPGLVALLVPLVGGILATMVGRRAAFAAIPIVTASGRPGRRG